MYEFKFNKKFRHTTISVDFKVKEEETLVILGASGCGKTTILNIIAGFIEPEEGLMVSKETVFFDNQASSQKKFSVPVHKRGIGYIQQSPNIFPHLSVDENITYGSIRQEKDEQWVNKRNNYIKIFELEDCMNKPSSVLSGGQQQRVAIVRALMSEPKLLLFDEPFSALDPPLRKELGHYLKKLKEHMKIPTIFVTHDLKEAFEIGDRIVFMKQGKFIEEQSASDFLKSPIYAETAAFIGVENIIESKKIPELKKMNNSIDGDTIGVRAIDFILSPEAIDKNKTFLRQDEERINFLECAVVSIEEHYEYTKMSLVKKDTGIKLRIKVPKDVARENNIEVGDIRNFYVNRQDIILLKRVGEKND